jgi:methyl-accepting chemotaxis protein
MRTMTLGAKLVSVGVALVLIPLLVVSFFFVRKTTEVFQTDARRQLTLVAANISNTIQLVLSEELKIVKELSARSTIVELSASVAKKGIADSQEEIARLDRELVTLVKQIGKDYDSIFIANPEGLIHSSGSGVMKKIGLSIAERDYFKGAKEGKLTIGSVIKSKKAGETVVPICTPIRSDSGEFVGFLGMALKTDFFSHLITDVKIGEKGTCFLVDQNGRVIIHPNKELILEVDTSKIEGMKEISRKYLNHQTGVDAYVYEGVEKIGGYAPVELTGWTGIASVPVKEVYAPIYSLRNVLLFIGSICLGCAVIFVFLFARRLTKLIERIIEGLDLSTGNVASASSQVAQASRQLADGASEQAASVEETSSSLEEMASMTRQNTGNAAHANQLMSEAKTLVEQANESMKLLGDSIHDISRASEDTQKIIKTIDEIAFQTNLLALNAAVEAARAGEAGAGFAVVADEVRNLAMRAADAAKSTANLIEGTVRKVKQGSELVKNNDDKFQKVASTVVKSAELIGDIAAASNEQALGIDQINKAVSEMDKIIQQNASIAEESSAASEEMSAQAEQLQEFVESLVELVGGRKEGKAMLSTGQGSDSATMKGSAPGASNTFLPSNRNNLKASAPVLSERGSKEVGPEDLIDVDF